MKLLGLLLNIITFRFCCGIIGHDCGTKSLNVTTVSLLEVGECNIPENEIKAEDTMIQLL